MNYQNQIDFTKFVEVMGWRAVGNKLCGADFNSLELTSKEEPKETGTQGELF